MVLASISALNLHGGRGGGILYRKENRRSGPLQTVCGQESDLRYTTDHVAGIAASARALQMTFYTEALVMSNIAKMKQDNHSALEDYAGGHLNTDEAGFAPNIITFGIRSVRRVVVAHAFVEHDIYSSTSSACASKSPAIAGTLIAMGVPKKAAQTAVRSGLDYDAHRSKGERFVTIIAPVYAKTPKVRRE